MTLWLPFKLNLYGCWPDSGTETAALFFAAVSAAGGGGEYGGEGLVAVNHHAAVLPSLHRLKV